MTHDLADIAAELARTKPSDCDDRSGYCTHEDGTIGWYTDGGNVGHPVLRVAPEAIEAVHARLAARPDAIDDTDPRQPPLRKLLAGIDGCEVMV